MKPHSTLRSSSLRSLLKLLAMVVALGLATVSFAGRAEAKGVIIYQTGEDIFQAGDGSLPAPFAEMPELKAMKAGYKCNVFAIFWTYFSISDCQPVAYVGDSFVTDPALAAAITAKSPESDMQVGLWGRWGKVLLIAIVVVAAGLAAWGHFQKSPKDEEATA